MDVYKYLDNNTILIIPSNLKDYILNIINEKPLFNIKVMTLDDLKKKLIFEYDAQTIYYTMKEKSLSYQNSVEIIESLYFLTDKINNPKLKDLSEFMEKLKINKLINFDHYVLESLKNKNVIVFGFDYLYKFDRYLINKIKEITKVNIIPKKDNDYIHNLLKFKNINEEIEYVAKEILVKINNGININNIFLANYNDEYSLTIKRIFNFYKIPINLKSKTSLYDTTIGIKLLNNLSDYENILSEIKNADIYNAVIEIFNKYFFVDDFRTIKTILTEEFKLKKINKPKFKNAVNLIEIKDNYFDDNKHVFLIGFIDKMIPSIYKDDNYINDAEKNELLESTEEFNEIEIKIWENLIKNIKNLTITYSKENLKEICFPSSLSNNLNIVEKEYEISLFSHQSNKYNLALLLDLEKKYGEINNDVLRLYNNYKDINYLSYDNQYNGINSVLLQKKLNILSLSYTKLNTYYECNFKYYLNYILKLDNYEETFEAYLGSLVHHILSKIDNKQFNLLEEKEWFLRNKDFNLKPENYIFIDKICEELDYIIDFINEHYENSLFKNIECEKSIKVNIKGDLEIVFSGIIDKIMTYEDKVAIIDYKTYVPNIDLSLTPYGLGMQLPIYIYLVKAAYPKARIAGIYLQNVNRKILMDDDKKDLEKIRRDSLKLVGYTLDNEAVIKEFDSTYKNSRFIKGMKTTTKGFSHYTKLLGENEFKEIFRLTRNKIKEGADNILNAKFAINPKVVSQKNISCTFCKYKSICFMKEENQIYLTKDKDLTFLKEVER